MRFKQYLVVSVLAMMPVVAAVVARPGAAQPVEHRLVLPMVAADQDVSLIEGPTPYEPGTRTGIAEVDAVLDALESDSPNALQALLEPVPAPCVVNPQGITNPPLCPEGVTAGTPVPVFRAMGCESFWPEYLSDVLVNVWGKPRLLLAVYTGPTDYFSWLPPAEYAIVVSRGEKGAEQDYPFVVRVVEGRVNGIAFGCGTTYAEFTDGIEASRYAVAPLNWP